MRHGRTVPDEPGCTSVPQIVKVLPDEQTVCNAMIGGYPVKDVKAQLKIHGVHYHEFREAVLENPLECLV